MSERAEVTESERDCGLRRWCLAYNQQTAAVVTREDDSAFIDVTMKPGNHQAITLCLHPHQAKALIHDLLDALAVKD